MRNVAHRRKKNAKRGTPVGDISASMEPSSFEETTVPLSSLPKTVCVHLSNGRWLGTEVRPETAAVADTKQQAEDAVRNNVRRKRSSYDFYTSLSAADLAKSQGVKPIRRVGQIHAFSAPDPMEANWLAREVRRWRREGRSQRRFVR
jgi:hypothetical protein